MGAEVTEEAQGDQGGMCRQPSLFIKRRPPTEAVTPSGRRRDPGAAGTHCRQKSLLERA